MNPSEVSEKGAGSLVPIKLPQQNRFTELELDDSLESSGQSTFAGAADGISYSGK